jgi:hypothetical protein
MHHKQYERKMLSDNNLRKDAEMRTTGFKACGGAQDS